MQVSATLPPVPLLPPVVVVPPVAVMIADVPPIAEVPPTLVTPPLLDPALPAAPAVPPPMFVVLVPAIPPDPPEALEPPLVDVPPVLLEPPLLLEPPEVFVVPPVWAEDPPVDLAPPVEVAAPVAALVAPMVCSPSPQPKTIEPAQTTRTPTAVFFNIFPRGITGTRIASLANGSRNCNGPSALALRNGQDLPRIALSSLLRGFAVFNQSSGLLHFVVSVERDFLRHFL